MYTLYIFFFNTINGVDIGNIEGYFILRGPFSFLALIGGELEDFQANFESILGYRYIFLFKTFHGVGIGYIERYFFLRVPFIMALMRGEFKICRVNF